ncbi:MULTISPECIES: hypothetical protein [unclassified Cryobacterium]|uniref:hypothetical protein n=1 Tax=unclassified Cryobacterium TaxID=2649013 RepID=UPI002AB3D9A7|nr:MULTISPECIES: hypothetical protein [unclassified Cryobacterium]MDY7528272.1 hypothetical protein [Cryobacterium sp. 10C2]MEB0002992.1 hypothetical protein [Cryobacterium sp. RTC2.1]MEB0290507.1 hypothetical protein [Cryobacterium sp. 10C2]
MPVETPAVLARVRERIATLAEKRRTLIRRPADHVRRGEILALDDDLREIIGGLRDRLDPCDASPEVPLVLLPVRIESKLTPGTSTLRVRISPDEAHIDSLLRSVTDAEVAAGAAYWSAVWTDVADAVAWPALSAAVGERRAGWVAEVTTPTNLATRGQGAPIFPASPEEVAHGAVARCLPDQFVVRVFPNGAAPITVTGSPVATDVPLSPIAFGDDELSQVAGLTVPVGSEWTVDFEAAKKAGLGVEVQLPGGTTLIDRIVVVGTRNSVSEEANAADFVDLLTSHRFSDGVSLLAAGTATNNADAERSPYRPAASAGAPPVESRTPSRDAILLAAALGLDAASVEHLIPAGPVSTLDEAQAAANTALWFATWEPVLERLDDLAIPAVTPGSIESARRLHRDYVRGAGAAPALRIGAQPYGVLPVTDLDAWQPRSGETTAQLVPLIRRTLARWVSRSPVVPHVRPGGQLDDQDLLDMLGTSPVSTGVRARPAVDGPQLASFAAATGADPAQLQAEAHLRTAVLAQFSVDAAKILQTPAPHDDSRTIGLPLVSERDADVVAEILAGTTPKVDSVLQALLDIAWDGAKRLRFRAAPQEFVGPLIDFVELDPEIRRIITVAASADAAVDDTAPERFFAAAERVAAVQHFDGQPTERVSIAAIEPVAEARTSLAQVALDLGDTAQARWLGSSAITELLYAFGVGGEVRAAMIALAAAPLDERRIAVASALDLASHRVDAWATGIATARRATLAATAPVGMTIGAFGYVEQIRLGTNRSDPDGWIHAPSSSHAVAAGVLASAHRSNIGALPGKQPFAIDLSSRRGVELRRVLEGVAAGQSIGALLGYQIERGLAGTSAARFQLSLRQIAPAATDQLGNDEAQEVAAARVAAADVVDGAELLRLFPLDTLTVVNPPLRARLSRKPDNAFVENWDPVSKAEWDLLVAAMRGAAATLDAVSDALLSESVLQYSSGNPSRASAAMDAMASGAAVDPDLGILGVRQTGRILTHGVFAAIPAGATGWSSTRPRALAEPRLEAWAARRLGDPAGITVTEAPNSHTLAEAGWAALDLVFADDAASLDRELRAAIPALGDSPLADGLLRAATLAGSLRSLAAGGTPLGPDSLVRTGVAPERRIDTDELLARVGVVLDALAAVLASGQAVIAAIDSDGLAVEEDAVADVIDAVRGLAAFGVPLIPDTAIPANVAWAVGAWQAAFARLGQARATLVALRDPARDVPATTGEIVDACRAVAEGILGDGFLLLPLLTEPAGTDSFHTAIVTPAMKKQPAHAHINAFLRDHATVQAGVGRLAEAQLLGGALGIPIPLRIVQLTEHDDATGDPAAGTERWLAGSLPDDVPWPAASASHLVVELVGGHDDFAGPFAGLAIDGWAETLPFQPDPKAFDPAAPDNPLRAARATTGLAVHANQASARAPQVLLSAVSPDGTRWTTDSVVATVLEAVKLAKARLVTYEHTPGDAAILPAIYVASPWLQIRTGLQFTELAKVKWSGVGIPFLSEVK